MSYQDYENTIWRLDNQIEKLEAENKALREGIANARLCDTIVQMDECLATLQEQGVE